MCIGNDFRENTKKLKGKESKEHENVSRHQFGT
jgi:hypothetical protein